MSLERKISRAEWLRVDWSLSNEEIAAKYDVSVNSVQRWRRLITGDKLRKGRLVAVRCEDHLYDALEYQADLLGLRLGALVRMALFEHLQEYPVTYTVDAAALTKILRDVAASTSRTGRMLNIAHEKLREEEQLRVDDWLVAVEREEARLKPLGTDRLSRRMKKMDE